MSNNAVGCVAHYLLNDNVATTAVIDEVGSFTGTATDNTSTLSSTDSASNGRSFELNGIDEYIDTGDAFQSTWRSSFTISLWVKPDDGQPASIEYFLGATNAGGEDRIYVSLLTTGVIRFLIESDNDLVFHDSGVVFTNGQQGWHHIVLVGIADTTLGLFFDSIDKGTSDASGLVFNDWTSSEEIFIGAYDSVGTPGDYFAGKIDNVKIFNRALTIDEVRRLYNAGNGITSLEELDNVEQLTRTLRRR